MSIFKFKLQTPKPNYLGKWFKTQDDSTYFYIEKDFYNEDVKRLAYLLRREYFHVEEQIKKDKKIEINDVSRKSVEENILSGYYIEIPYEEVLKFSKK